MNIFDLIILRDTWVNMIEENLHMYPESISWWNEASFSDAKESFVQEGSVDDKSLGDCVCGSQVIIQLNYQF